MNGFFFSKMCQFTGGPLILEHDYSLIGVTRSIVDEHGTNPISLQLFTFLPYYYDWIEREAGLNPPKCRKPQEN